MNASRPFAGGLATPVRGESLDRNHRKVLEELRRLAREQHEHAVLDLEHGDRDRDREDEDQW